MRSLTLLDERGAMPPLQALSEQDATRPVVLIGFQKQGNLGIGYLAATLMRRGHRVKVLDFEDAAEQILATIEAEAPVVVGFSLIFQFYLPRFRALMQYLRNHGVRCHFTIGGHFPSLSHERTLELIPEVDSVVRFEGEVTLLELVESLIHDQDWRRIDGLAYRRDGRFVSNPLRHLLDDLDVLPFPYRQYEPTAILGQRTMPILASRGCSRTCSFCSIHMFYRAAPGRVVRIRKVTEVVREMKDLYQNRGITLFLFQDDDFPLFGPSWRRWALSLVDELYRQDLVGKVIWKISCRADAVEPELFATLRDAGLYLVYMGLESGSDDGLDVLHKEITVAENLRAVETLKSLGLMWEFGFMLFDPSSTFESIETNVGFLRRIVDDGSVAAVFCKMLPYDGTPIKETLMAQGRFNGDVCNPDYDFLDPRIARCYEAIGRTVGEWVRGSDCVAAMINHAWHEVFVMERLFEPGADLVAYKTALSAVTKFSNNILFSVVEEICDGFREGGGECQQYSGLGQIREQILATLVQQRNRYVYENQSWLLKGISKQTLVTA
ncbi:MAG TPA: radical SAM protein [Nitrospira sp.]|nr:radical SAM protein [Nitrospira sp.]